MTEPNKKENKFEHIPVLPEETVSLLNVQSGGIYVDGTLGGAGHSKLIASRIGLDGRLIGIDQDVDALAAAQKVLAEESKRIDIVRGNFRYLGEILDDLGINTVDGILLDLGVSTHQLQTPERGFSFSEKDENLSATLDMRMDRDGRLSAYEIINDYSEDKLKEIFYQYGEEPYGGKIARQVIRARAAKKIKTTNDLLEIIRSATPPKYRFGRTKGHYASKVFRAIRMEVNQELQVVREVIPQAVERLNPGGRLVIITFHSLEDRIVKHAFRELAHPENIYENPTVNLLTRKPVIATDEEQYYNPKSTSAKIRAIEKI